MSSNTVGIKNAIVLSLAQALSGSIGSVAFALGALAGAWLMPNNLALATLPVAMYSVGTAALALPVAALGRKFGRRLSFIIGALIGIIGAGLSVTAIAEHNFVLFCIGYFLIGGASAFTQQYRFAAADSGDDKFKSRAISWVLMGGVLAAFIGTETVLRTKDMLDPLPFAGGYIGMAGLLALAIIVLLFLKPVSASARQALKNDGNEGRPLPEIMRQPVFITALLCGVASFGLMSFMMTGAPLAMHQHGHSQTNAVLGIRWHVLAMYAPSFITGGLIVRFGKLPIIATGLSLLLLCAGVALSGLALWNFWTSLILLGIGWNFSFIGATALLGEAYNEAEKNRVQGMHDFILFSCVAIASLASGVVLNSFGWNGIAFVIIPFSLAAGLSLLWLSAKRRRIIGA